MQFPNRGDNPLDLIVAETKGVGDGVLRHFETPGFDHHDGFFASSDDDIQQALFLLGRGGVGDKLSLEQTHADGGNRLGKGQVGDKGRGGGAGNGDDVGVVFAVGGQNQADDLRFIAPSLGKQGAERAIDQPRNEDFALGGTAFALEEAPGNFTGGVGVLAIIDRQRQKIAVVGMRIHAGGNEKLGVSILDENGAVCLFGQLSRFKGQQAAANFNLYLMRSGLRHNFDSFRRIHAAFSANVK